MPTSHLKEEKSTLSPFNKELKLGKWEWPYILELTYEIN